MANWPATRPTFTIGERGREGHHHRHLQEHAEEIADVVGGMLAEALGAVAALEQESLARSRAPERPLELARLACKNERRIARKLALGLGERRQVLVDRRLLDGLRPPAVGRPTLFQHFTTPRRPSKEPPFDRNRSDTRTSVPGMPISGRASRKPGVCGGRRSRLRLRQQSLPAPTPVRRRDGRLAHHAVHECDDAVSDIVGPAYSLPTEISGAVGFFMPTT